MESPSDITRGRARNKKIIINKKNPVNLHNSIRDMVGRVTLSQPAGGKNTTKNDPTTTKTQLQQDSLHKWHKGHPKSIKFRRSRRLHY